MTPFVVGITGCSGSGKTFVLNKIMESLPVDSVALLSMDHYYKPVEQQVRDENNVIHFDLPESIDESRFSDDLSSLLQGETLELPEYTFNVHDREPQMLVITPAPIVIVEGIFSFYYPSVNAQLDMRVFIEASESTMLQRRIERDEAERGYHDRSVRYRFEQHVLPVYRKLILPTRETADYLVNNEVEPNLEIVVNHLKMRLSE